MFQANVEMDPVGPQIHVVNLAEVALLECCQLLAPLAGQSLNSRGAQPCLTAEELG